MGLYSEGLVIARVLRLKFFFWGGGGGEGGQFSGRLIFWWGLLWEVYGIFRTILVYGIFRTVFLYQFDCISFQQRGRHLEA